MKKQNTGKRDGEERRGNFAFDFCGFVHHSIIRIENPTNATVYQNFISYLYEVQHVSGDTPPIFRSLKLH